MEKYLRLNRDKRIEIETLFNIGMSFSEIAKKLNCHRSTIYREINRNVDNKLKIYSAIDAQSKATERFSKCRRRKKIYGSLKIKIKKRLKDGWSPEQIAGRLKLENSIKTVSHETIYRFIHFNRFQECGNLYLFLRKKRTRLKRRIDRNAQRKIIYRPPFTDSIHKRPHSANARSRVGHWERDTMMFQGSRKTNLLVIVDRKSRFTKIEKMKSHEALETAKKTEHSLRKDKFKVTTITNDRGVEFRQNFLIDIKSNFIAPIYFCDPYTPGQRGTVENTIGLLRQIFPKDFNINKLTEAKIRKAEKILNCRPRKCLDFFTPEEVIKKSRVALVT